MWSCYCAQFFFGDFCSLHVFNHPALRSAAWAPLLAPQGGAIFIQPAIGCICT
jgi:hypothetical protein